MAYFTADEFRARYDASQLGQTVTDSEISTAREIAEEILEDACGVAFEPRTTSETLTLDRGGEIRLSNWPVRALTSIAVNGEALTVSDYGVLDNERVSPNVPFSTGENGLGTVVVSYSYGMDAPPARVKRAAMILARQHLVEGPVTDRALGQFSDVGVIRLSTPGVGDAVTGLPEVDATIAQYRIPSLG